MFRAAPILTVSLLILAHESPALAGDVVFRHSFENAGVIFIECPNLVPAVGTAVPLAEIDLGSLPDILEPPLSGEVRWEGGDEIAFTFVNRLDDLTASMLAPPHPTADLDGGDVSILISDGQFACPAFDFHVESLPEAPGEFIEIVGLFEQLQAAQAALVGTTPEVLKVADPLALSDAQLPLVVIQSVLDHPANPNSLRAIADGKAPYTEGIDHEDADRVLALTGLRQALEESLAEAGGERQFRGDALPANADDCLLLDIDTAPDLDFCMDLAVDAAFEVNGATNEVLGAIGNAVTIFGSLVQGEPRLKLLASAASYAIWLVQKSKEGTANLLPSELTLITAEAAPQIFNEDQAGPGDWLADVKATSQGWLLDQVALEGLFQFVMMSQAQQAWVTQKMPPGLTADIQNLLQTLVINQIIDSSGGTGFFEISAEPFGPVDISDMDWSERDILTGNSIEFVGHTEYEPRQVGVTNIDIRSKGGEFGGQQINLDPNLEIEVLQLDLDFLYQSETVSEVFVSQPNQVVHLKVEVENASHPEFVDLDDQQPISGMATISWDGAMGGNPSLHSVEYTAPSSLEGLPDLLVAQSTATSGALGEPGAPVRAAVIEVKLAEITIEPEEVCLDPGGMITFSATVDGLPSQDVTWSASAGMIDAISGDYTAPLDPQTVIIAAVSATHPEVFAELPIQVGGCNCQWSGQADGSGFVGVEDDFAWFGLNAGLTAVETLSVVRDDSQGQTPGAVDAAFTSLGDPPIPIGVTGSFPVVVAGELGQEGSSGYTSFPFEEGVETTALISENTGDLLVGTITGTIFLFDPLPDGRVGSFNLQFRIERDPKLSDPQFATCSISAPTAE